MGSMKSFDKKFGQDFVSGLPACPGVYRMFNAESRLIYVGKAKNLRRRLGQYRNAGRLKKHRKMRSIIAGAARIEYSICESDLEACLLEMKLIQAHRPKWNVAGAFHFLYPMIGLKQESGEILFCCTTTPDQFEGFEFHGSYRSRTITREAFHAWMRLLRYVGHETKWKRSAERVRYSSVYRFRQIDAASLPLWTSFLRGESREALEQLALALLESAAARRDSAEVQEDLKTMQRFWRTEASRLRRAIRRTAFGGYPVPQAERDLLFLRYRHSFMGDSSSSAVSLDAGR